MWQIVMKDQESPFSGMIGSLAIKALKPNIELCVAFKWQQLR